MKHRIPFSIAFLLSILIIGGLPLASGARQAGVERPVVARITVRDAEELERLVRRGLDLLEARRGQDLFVLTTLEKVAQLREEGWEIAVDEDATAANMVSEARIRSLFSGGYISVSEIRERLESMAALYPGLAELSVYGRSWQRVSSGSAGLGHDLYAIRLTNRSIPGPKPVFLLFASIHAREIVTSDIAMRLIEYLLSNYGVNGDVRGLLDENVIVVAPMVNPDGRILAETGWMQRKNTNRSYATGCSDPPDNASQYGVDLNRNFSYRWGTIDKPTDPPCNLTYPGPSVASEPETVALQELVRSLFADQRGPNPTDPAPDDASGILISLHSYGDLVLWPWGSTYAEAPNGRQFEAIGKKFAAYNGYAARQAIYLYPVSGATDDWSYSELGIASFTFEIGPDFGLCSGFFPPFECMDSYSSGQFWRRNLPALLYAARIARAPYRLALGPSPEDASAVVNDDGSVTLQATFDDGDNGKEAIAEAVCYVGLPPWKGGAPLPMTAADGTFDSTRELATVRIPQGAAGRLIYVRARDLGGNWGPARSTLAARSVYNHNPRASSQRTYGARQIQHP